MVERGRETPYARMNIYRDIIAQTVAKFVRPRMHSLSRTTNSPPTVAQQKTQASQKAHRGSPDFSG